MVFLYALQTLSANEAASVEAAAGSSFCAEHDAAGRRIAIRIDERAMCLIIGATSYARMTGLLVWQLRQRRRRADDDLIILIADTLD